MYYINKISLILKNFFTYRGVLIGDISNDGISLLDGRIYHRPGDGVGDLSSSPQYEQLL